MAKASTTRGSHRVTVHTAHLTTATIIATAIAACVGQIGLAIPAVLNGLFQQDLGTTSFQLTWISDAFLVPVSLLELTFGVMGDLFGRKRLLIGGSALLAVGEIVSVLTPGPVDTSMFDTGPADVALLRPRDVALAARYLAELHPSVSVEELTLRANRHHGVTFS